jgi:hypothetical protein
VDAPPFFISCFFSTATCSGVEDLRSLTEDKFEQLLDQHVQMTEKVYEGIVASREKDMTNPFRKMVFDDEEEQLAVIGKLSDNAFIKQKEVEKKELNRAVEKIKKKLRAVLH